MPTTMPVPAPNNVAWPVLHADVERLLTSHHSHAAGGHIVLVCRLHGANRGFSLDPEVMRSHLQGALRSLGHAALPVKIYSGAESPEETVRLFGASRGVLLYHGAALSNLAFATKRVCVVELTAPDSATSTIPSIAWCDRMAPAGVLPRGNQTSHPRRSLVSGHHAPRPWRCAVCGVAHPHRAMIDQLQPV